MRGVVQWADDHQVALYLTSIVVAALFGTTQPEVARPTAVLINPVLILLLYATFLSIPLTGLMRALRDPGFLVPLLVLNFLAAPAVVFALSRFVAGESGLLLGVLLVLLCPCVDYVMVFTGLAGGANDRLLAASPVLMLGQMLLLPLYLRLMAGPDGIAGLELAPFVEAFVVLIATPLVAALATQWVSRTRVGRVLTAAAAAAMVPLMMLTLAVVVASQSALVGTRLGSLAPVVPVFVAFAAVMLVVGWGVGALTGYDVAARRALVFSGMTRNSLVVLPLALALPATFSLAPLVVVSQTLVELVTMALMVRVVPRMIPGRTS